MKSCMLSLRIHRIDRIFRHKSLISKQGFKMERQPASFFENGLATVGLLVYLWYNYQLVLIS